MRGKYAKNRNRSYQGKDDKSEQEMWSWYWDIKFKREKLDKGTRKQFKLYDYKFYNEKYFNNKSHQTVSKNIYQK